MRIWETRSTTAVTPSTRVTAWRGNTSRRLAGAVVWMRARTDCPGRSPRAVFGTSTRTSAVRCVQGNDVPNVGHPTGERRRLALRRSGSNQPVGLARHGTHAAADEAQDGNGTDCAMQTVRMTFTIEQWSPEGRLMARDADGTIVAMGWSVEEVVESLMGLLRVLFDQAVPRSLEVRGTGDGRVVFTSVHETARPPPQRPGLLN